MKHLILALALPLSLLAGILTGCRKTQPPGLSLEDLASYRSLPVTIEGRLQLSAMTGDSCYYAEWAYGPMHTDGTTELVSARQTIDSVDVVTPKGLIRLDVYQMRLFIGSYFSRTFNTENIASAPTPIQVLLKKHPGTISVQEYLLHPDRTYYARVHTDTIYMALTDSDDDSEFVTRPILELSDLPFTEEAPPRPPTPAYAE